MNDTNESRRLSAWENELKDVFAAWVAKELPGADASEISRVLGLDFKRAKLLAGLSTCGEAIRGAVLSNSLHAENAPVLETWETSERDAFLSFSQTLSFSLQTEREFLEWLPEIAFLKKTTVAAIVASDEICIIKNNAKLSAPQKIQKIRTHLFSLRFPRFNDSMRKWKQLSQKTFSAMPGVVVTPSPYFEKNKLELRISLSNADEGRKVLKKLAAIPTATWASLIDPTEGSGGAPQITSAQRAEDYMYDIP